MYTLETIKHSDASSFDLDRAIAIKQVAWPYPKESQLQWMQDNLQPEDIHVFLKEDNNDVAYLNIAWVHAQINGVHTLCAGIGNVCSKMLRKGYGHHLMERLTDELNEYIGLLFCKEELVAFYIKCNWILINPQNISFSCGYKGINTMVYNIHGVEKLVYDDRIF